LSPKCNSVQRTGILAQKPHSPGGGVSRFQESLSIQDRLLDSLRRCSQDLPDRRPARNTTDAMADFALGAFAPSFMQSASFLAHQRHLETGQGRSNCKALFGMRKIPGDSQIRAKLDAVESAMFHRMFADIMAELEQSGGLDAMRCLDGQVLIALDGTEFHCSEKIHCANCAALTLSTDWRMSCS
jgi:hypothetical protein